MSVLDIGNLLKVLPDEDEDCKMPGYDAKGWLEVNIVTVNLNAKSYEHRYEIDDYEYEDTSCVWLIDEGVGIDFWLDNYIELETPGRYRIEGITGFYFKRNSFYGEDDDEDWFFEKVIKLKEL